MARKTLLVSDISGEEIEDGKGATIRINPTVHTGLGLVAAAGERFELSKPRRA
jgi:hypothetical protein